MEAKITSFFRFWICHVPFTRNCITGFLKLYVEKIATWSSHSIFGLCAFIIYSLNYLLLIAQIFSTSYFSLTGFVLCPSWCQWLFLLFPLLRQSNHTPESSLRDCPLFTPLAHLNILLMFCIVLVYCHWPQVSTVQSVVVSELQKQIH